MGECVELVRYGQFMNGAVISSVKFTTDFVVAATSVVSAHGSIEVILVNFD